jgi:hypothetical protein
VSKLRKLEPELHHSFLVRELLLLTGDTFVRLNLELVGSKLRLKLLVQAIGFGPRIDFGPLHFGHSLREHSKGVFGSEIIDRVLRVTALPGGLLAHQLRI